MSYGKLFHSLIVAGKKIFLCSSTLQSGLWCWDILNHLISHDCILSHALVFSVVISLFQNDVSKQHGTLYLKDSNFIRCIVSTWKKKCHLY